MNVQFTQNGQSQFLATENKSVQRCSALHWESLGPSGFWTCPSPDSPSSHSLGLITWIELQERTWRATAGHMEGLLYYFWGQQCATLLTSFSPSCFLPHQLTFIIAATYNFAVLKLMGRGTKF